MRAAFGEKFIEKHAGLAALTPTLSPKERGLRYLLREIKLKLLLEPLSLWERGRGEGKTLARTVVFQTPQIVESIRAILKYLPHPNPLPRGEGA
jgi:hypothetical protein